MKSSLIAVLVILSIILQIPVFAHTPQKIMVDYNLKDSIVKIAVLHPTPNQIKHRIDRLVLQLNDEEIVVQKFLKQKDPGKQVAIFILPGLKVGDKLAVVAHCNVFGKKKINIIVE